MSRVDIQARDGGCDRVSIIETMVDGVKYWPASGDFMYPCNTTFSAHIETSYISQFKVAGNQIYLNGSLYWSSSNLQYHNICQSGTCIQVAGSGTNECATPGQACTQSSGSSSTLLLIGAAIATGLAYYFSQQKKKKQEE